MIPKGHRRNFRTMQKAFKNGDIALAECTDKKSGRPVYTVCMVNRDGEAYVLVPVAKMFDGNPYEEVDPPR